MPRNGGARFLAGQVDARERDGAGAEAHSPASAGREFRGRFSVAIVLTRRLWTPTLREGRYTRNYNALQLPRTARKSGIRRVAAPRAATPAGRPAVPPVTFPGGAGGRPVWG